MSITPREPILQIDIDDKVCIRCRVCCAEGCNPAPSIFRDPEFDAPPVIVWPRERWIESDIENAVFGCPVGAISVEYETYRLTEHGIESRGYG